MESRYGQLLTESVIGLLTCCVQIPEEHEVLSVWSYDHYAMSGGEAVKQLSVAVAVFGLLLTAIYAAKPEVPMVRREYPYSGLIRELGSIEENKVRIPLEQFSSSV